MYLAPQRRAIFRPFFNIRACCILLIFFLLTFAQLYLLSSDSTSLLCFFIFWLCYSALLFQLSILSEVRLLNFLWWYVHIVRLCVFARAFQQIDLKQMHCIPTSFSTCMLHIWCLHQWLSSPMTAKCQAVVLQPGVCPWSIAQIHMEGSCNISRVLPANFCSKGVLKHAAKAEQLHSVQRFETLSALPKLYLLSNEELSQAARFICFFSSSLRARFSVKATMQELLNVLSSEMITPGDWRQVFCTNPFQTHLYKHKSL